MKWPRKGILIRLAIYLPVIGFLAYQGFFRGGEEEAPAQAPQEPKVRFITPEQAREMGVDIHDSPPGIPAGDDSSPEPTPVVPPDDTRVPNG